MIRRDVHLSPTQRYVAYLPDGYDCQPARNWPALLFLHGSGERGNDLEQVNVHGPTKEVSEGRRYPFIILAPQLSPEMGEHWLPETLAPLLEDMQQRLLIDEKRWYITGLSLGGFGTIAMLQRWPEKFAAALAIAGCNIYDYVSEQEVGSPCRAAKVPTWLIHGKHDYAVPIESTERYYQMRKRCESKVPIRYEETDDAHDAWSAVYAADHYWNWMMGFRR